MNRYTKTFLAALSLVLSGVVLFLNPGTAQAQEPPPPTATVSGLDVTITFDRDISGPCPANYAFSITVDGEDWGNTFVWYAPHGELSGCDARNVYLRLPGSNGSRYVAAGRVVTLSYTSMPSAVLTYANGDRVPNFTGVRAFNLKGEPASDGRLSSAKVNGKTLTLTFDKQLGTSVPPGRAFTVRTFHGGGTDSDGTPLSTCNITCRAAVSAVAISGRNVTLTLSEAIPHGAKTTVAYTPHVGNALHSTNRDDYNNYRLVYWSGHRRVNVLTPLRPTVFTRAGVFTYLLGIHFSNALQPGRTLPPTAFTVQVTSASGQTRTIVPVKVHSVSTSGVVLWLAPQLDSQGLLSEVPVLPGETVTLSYETQSDNPLLDKHGNPVESFSNKPVNNGVPQITSVSLSSDAGTDQTYALDDVIRVSVAFNDAIFVRGTPRLRLDLDPAAGANGADLRWATYESGHETQELIFAYQVAGGDSSTQGIAVVENSLEENGGGLHATWGRTGIGVTAANLSHSGVAHSTDHKVDGAGGAGGLSAETIPPAQPVTSPSTANAASVTAVTVTSDAGDDNTYAKDDIIQVTVTFSEAVDVTGTPQIAIDMDPAEWGTKQAAYEGGSGTASLVFAHTVVEPNTSTQGIAVLADTLALNGGTIQSAADVDADLSHTGLAHDANHKVDWQLEPEGAAGSSGGAGGDSGSEEESAPASVTGVAVSSNAGSDNTYVKGDVIQITVTFSEAVDVTGSPRLKIDMDPAEWGAKWASYQSGSGTTTLTFTHTVVEPNISTQGIAVLSNTLKLNGGTIQAASDADADLSHTGLSHDANHKVRWQPAVTAVAVTSDAGGDNTYARDDVIQITVTFSEAVDVTGSPRLKIDMDPAEWGAKWASYQSGSGTTTLTFTHTVVEPNISTQGIAVLSNTLKLNGGTIQAASDADADLSHTGLSHDANHKVDWQLEPPAGL